jgi:hypothetical protein
LNNLGVPNKYIVQDVEQILECLYDHSYTREVKRTLDHRTWDHEIYDRFEFSLNQSFRWNSIGSLLSPIEYINLIEDYEDTHEWLLDLSEDRPIV